ncbi:MAG: alpha-L-fucosidase [Bacteroidota bacterium]|nr:alpha-L-fucosidase [Bacteroidota bacterium]
MKTNVLKSKLALMLLFLLGITTIKATEIEPMETGKFQPTWESLKQYSAAPEWFEDAKFGIWAHWGPQCQPELGDWFARFMYFDGSQRNWFTSNYGTDPKLGFKEVMNSWKAESWNPDTLVKVYKAAGARYFFALGNHHDNMDLWDSKYQPWNSAKIGPKKDLLSGWEKAARAQGLYFGVSIHASHAWSWYEIAQNYDGNLTAADGTGKWWAGLDPQDLYAQNHTPSSGWTSSGTIHSEWNWVNGASIPSAAYCDKFYNRTMDMINKYNPDLIYFDDTSLPLVAVDNSGNRSTSTVSDVGLKIAASYYNKGANANNGKVNNVIFGKILTEDEKECMVWDVERGIPDKPQKKHWQTCTCIGDWHYLKGATYKSASTVIHMLIDIVSKNGNLLLNIPLKGNGTYDSNEAAVLQGITAWMDVNKESIYSTRPWVIFGEGPSAQRANSLTAQGFNEGSSYDVKDIRYVHKGDSVLYVTLMGWPTNGKAVLESLGSNFPYLTQSIKSLKMLGGGELAYTRSADNLTITLPTTKPSTADIGIAFKITLNQFRYEDFQSLIKTAERTDSIAKLNVGTSTGQYNSDSIACLESAIAKAKLTNSSNTSTEIKAAADILQAAIISFVSGGRNTGGIINYPYSQNITKKYLSDARIFSRSDAITLGTSRFGLLGEPWVYNNAILNQSGLGGYDNYNSTQSIGIQKWNATDPAITNGKIYQTVTLPAGTYKLKIKINESWGYAKGENYLSVTAGNTVPESAKIPTEALAYYDMSTTSTASPMQINCCTFTLPATTQVSIGFSCTLAASATTRSMRVNEILLLDNAGNDISSTYLKNYTNIQRKDASSKRFGTPANWTSSLNIPQTDGSGTKQGIDKYPGYSTLMMGVWYDIANSTTDAKNAKLYKSVTLPAGKYFFGANYNTLYQMSSAYMFASKIVPMMSDVESTSIACRKIGADAADTNLYGIEFDLPATTTINLGWIADLSTNSTQEFRVNEVQLLKVMSASDTFDQSNAITASTNTDLVLKFSEFARVPSSAGIYSMNALDNSGYLAGTSGGSLDLGVIDFGANKYNKAYVYTANSATLSNDASYLLFLDADTIPFANIQALTTAGATFSEKSETTIGSISGLHNVKLKFNNHTSSLFSVGFVDANRSTGLNDVQINNSYKIYASNNKIRIEGVDNRKVEVYTLNGKLLKTRNNVVGSIEFNLESGAYLVVVGRKATKVILS